MVNPKSKTPYAVTIGVAFVCNFLPATIKSHNAYGSGLVITTGIVTWLTTIAFPYLISWFTELTKERNRKK